MINLRMWYSIKIYIEILYVIWKDLLSKILHKNILLYIQLESMFQRFRVHFTLRFLLKIRRSALFNFAKKLEFIPIICYSLYRSLYVSSLQ